MTGRTRSTRSERHAVVCWGELVWDLLPEGPRLGGALANVAYHLAQLNARPILVTRVGRDEHGREAIRRLTEAGVDTRFVQVDPARPTGSVRVTVVDGEPRYRIATEAAWDAMTFDDALSPVIAEADAVVFGTLAQRTALVDGALSRALSVARGMRVCDLNLRAPFDAPDAVDAALRRATVVKLNASEAALVARVRGVDDPVAALTAEGLFVALTRGAHGALLARGDARAEHPGVPAAPGGDAVGCGDAFTAVLTCGLLDGTSLPELVERACAYAGFVAEHVGAMPTVPPEVARAARRQIDAP